MTRHVWLLNMGGPDSPDAIQPFLQKLLGDPDLIQFPIPWLQPLFAWLVSRLRARKVLTSYQSMGGVSPQLAEVEAQTRALNKCLGTAWNCRPVYRYHGPGADQAAAAVARGDRVVLLSLYPQFSGATTASSINDARRALAGRQAEVIEVASYASHAGYVEAVAETVRGAIADLPVGEPYTVLFSAHGLPAKRVSQGDPYVDEVHATVSAVVAAVRLTRPHALSFQSKLGRGKWVEPSTLDTVQRLAAEGVVNLVVVPVAFTSEHIETLVELDEEVAAVARQAGVKRYVRAPTVSARPTFVRALADLVKRAEQEAGWA